MAARNRPDAYGWVSRVLHWVMAAAILGMLGFGTWLGRHEVTLQTYWLYSLHKSIGLTLLLLAVLRLAWHRISPPPPLLQGPRWQVAAARAGHAGLYLLMLAIPLTGWIASAATGIDVVAWGWTLPRVAPVSEVWETGFFAAHGVLTKLLLALVLVHSAAAIWHAAVLKDATLARMAGRAG